MKIAEESEHTYRIGLLSELDDSSPESLAKEMWPIASQPLDRPSVTENEDGGLSWGNFPLDPACEELLASVRPKYENKEYKAALKRYKNAALIYPQCYVAHLMAGNCLYFMEDHKKAIKWYEKAIDINPHHYQLHMYKANALLQLRKNEDALEAYITTLALRPRHPVVYKVLEAKSDALGITPYTGGFKPRALARREDDVIAVYGDEEKPYWLAYGLCKAIWIGEPNIREERVGPGEHLWSNIEDRECIMSLLESYYANREDDTVPPDPEMERILVVVKAGVLDAFVIYEIGSQVTPDIGISIPEQVRTLVHDYVQAYVVTRDGS
jgi:tetratricopeptide (TPR) repeat protein